MELREQSNRGKHRSGLWANLRWLMAWRARTSSLFLFLSAAVLTCSAPVGGAHPRIAGIEGSIVGGGEGVAGGGGIERDITTSTTTASSNPCLRCSVRRVSPSTAHPRASLPAIRGGSTAQGESEMATSATRNAGGVGGLGSRASGEECPLWATFSWTGEFLPRRDACPDSTGSVTITRVECRGPQDKAVWRTADWVSHENASRVT